MKNGMTIFFEFFELNLWTKARSNGKVYVSPSGTTKLREKIIIDGSPPAKKNHKKESLVLPQSQKLIKKRGRGGRLTIKIRNFQK